MCCVCIAVVLVMLACMVTMVDMFPTFQSGRKSHASQTCTVDAAGRLTIAARVSQAMAVRRRGVRCLRSLSRLTWYHGQVQSEAPAGGTPPAKPLSATPYKHQGGQAAIKPHRQPGVGSGAGDAGSGSGTSGSTGAGGAFIFLEPTDPDYESESDSSEDGLDDDLDI